MSETKQKGRNEAIFNIWKQQGLSRKIFYIFFIFSPLPEIEVTLRSTFLFAVWRSLSFQISWMTLQWNISFWFLVSFSSFQLARPFYEPFWWLASSTSYDRWGSKRPKLTLTLGQFPIYSATNGAHFDSQNLARKFLDQSKINWTCRA